MSSSKRPHSSPEIDGHPAVKHARTGLPHAPIRYVSRVTRDPEFDWFKVVTVRAFHNDPASTIASPFQVRLEDQRQSPRGQSGGEESDGELCTSDSELTDESDEEPDFVGSVFARLISRERIRSTFWEDMEEPSEDTAAMGFDVFDRYGHLRPEFINGSKKGSGVWGKELGFGNILQIEAVTVDREWRRHGIAAKLIETLLDKAKELDERLAFSLAWPVQLNTRDLEILMEDARKAKLELGTVAAVNLFRHLGFRRIGNLDWFCMAVDSSHPSRILAAADDFDPPDGPRETPLERLERGLEDKRTKFQFNFMTIVRSDSFRGYSASEVDDLVALRGIQCPTHTQLEQTRYGCTCGQCIEGFMSPRMHYTLSTQAEMMVDEANDTLDMFEENMSPLDFDCDDMFAPLGIRYLPSGVKRYYMTNKSIRRGHAQMFHLVSECLKRKQIPNLMNVLRRLTEESEWPPHTKNYIDRADGAKAAVEANLRYLFELSQAQDEKAGDGSFLDWDLDGGRDPAWNEYCRNIGEAMDNIATTRSSPTDEEWTLAYKEAEIIGKRRISDGSYVCVEPVKGEYVKAYEALPECRNDSEFGFVLGVLLEQHCG